ncbi:helix-turn-helix domain-containing protein [Streptomyces nymphaeiformis]|uniref:Transcriptional regulator with XRE-family HTH domain n=1 Tax=Streptomyces nymphaeiformis TaxID=2663842 RepID=A0A7W7U2B5_9ACTN|nr:helix-turn-helix transcriptional regulator [Streptomyces nymphaeiformis]MBB4983722.1 transcriptional regulator with XRE-family HTH domain [Streptomyces nymphaeiformis]
MSVDEVDGAGTEDAGWEVEPGDESGAAVVAAVGRQMKLWRESKGLSAVEFGTLIGYGEDLIRKIERGARIPRPEYLDKADEAVGASGLISAMKRDVEEVRYPKQVRSLAKLEARAVEFSLYSNSNIHGLLQTEEFARALLRTWRPAYGSEELERYVAARVQRTGVLEKGPGPEFSFIQEEATLKRPIGGKMVLRRQLERLLEVGDLPNVEIQVMPTEHADHPGTAGLIEILKFGDGTGVGRSDGDFNGRPVSDLKRLRILDLRYGIIRSKALTPVESRDFIEQLLGET